MEIITSTQNPLIKKIKKLGTSKKYREEENQILLDGIHLIEEYRKHNQGDIQLLVSKTFLKSEKYKAFKDIKEQITLPDDLLAKIAPTQTPQGILAIVPKPQIEPSKKIQKALILDHLQDPGNVGTIIRTALASNCQAIFLYNCTDIWSPKCLRAGQGAQFYPQIKCIETTSVKVIPESFIGKIYGMSLKPKSQDFFSVQISDSYAFALGNEGQGITPEVEAICDEFLYIPMHNGFESLNVGVTAGICLFRQ